MAAQAGVFTTLFIAALALPLGAGASSIDSASVDFGSFSKIKMLRLAVQSDWDQRWFASNGTHLGGYWEANLSYWRGDAYRNVPGQRQSLTDIGITPVWRFQADDKRGLYAEGAIGVHRLSQLYDNNDYRLSTHFQFGDHIGIGYVLANGWDIGAKIQHFSNGGYKKPNSGQNFFVVKAGTHF